MRTAAIEPGAAEPVASARLRPSGWLMALALTATVGAGLIAVVTAWRLPGFSAASESITATVLTLLAGLSLVGVGLEHVRRGRRLRFGALLASAGVLWLLTEWANPAIESSIGFTTGLVLGWIYPAVVVHALLLFGDDGLRRERAALVASGYAIFGVALGLVPAAAFDARAVHCSICPDDLVAFFPSVGLSGASIALGTVLGTAWSAIAAVVLAAALVHQSPAGRALRAPVLIPGSLFAVALAVELGRAAGRTVLPTGDAAHLLRLVEAALLTFIAVGVPIEWLRSRRSRTSVARVVADLGHSPPLGGLRDALASTLKDPELRIAYPLAGGRSVDAAGRDVVLDADPARGRRVTPIVRDGGVIALLGHRADVLEAPDTIDEVVRAARLGLEHERLQAETRAQLADLTAARKRIVAAARDERQRLERDLHDGAQQHLIAISIGIRLLSGEPSGLGERSARLVAEAGQELGVAIDELREVAHGIYPSVLADEGVAAAIESLAEGSTIPLSIGGLDIDPVDQAIAEAAYAVVADVVGLAAGPVRVRATRQAGALTLTLDAPSIPDDVLVELGDRVGAVDGTLTTGDLGPGRVELVAEFPCVS